MAGMSKVSAMRISSSIWEGRRFHMQIFADRRIGGDAPDDTHLHEPFHFFDFTGVQKNRHGTLLGYFTDSHFISATFIEGWETIKCQITA